MTNRRPRPHPSPERALNLPGTGPAPSGPTSTRTKRRPDGHGDGARHHHGRRRGRRGRSPRTTSDGNAEHEVIAESSAPIEWQVHETANFRIFHCDPALAQQAAAVAESVRTAQAKRWSSPAARPTWSPRCDLYLYPNPRSYAEATGQPEISPGISTMANNGIRVLSRRMNLRADNPLLLTATLPHEVTHIVLADVFVVQQIPRWADEGIAVLAEPATEQHHREADLRNRSKPVGSSRSDNS